MATARDVIHVTVPVQIQVERDVGMIITNITVMIRALLRERTKYSSVPITHAIVAVAAVPVLDRIHQHPVSSTLI